MSRPKSGKSANLVLNYVPVKQDQDKNARIATIIRGYLSMGYSYIEVAQKIGGNRSDVEWFLENY